MRLIDHPDNTAWMQAKQGNARADDIATFAARYQRENPSAWCVAVVETSSRVAAHHIRHLPEQMQVAAETCHLYGPLTIWVSNGRRAQCIQRYSPDTATGEGEVEE
ncbi:MAG: hypothetical protein M0Q49_01975 [Porticoccaceae bacterium]|nr:hypothetical protein [Porticoccaceae bacterium]